MVLCSSSPIGLRLVPWRHFQEFGKTGVHGEGTRVRWTRQASKCWTSKDCELHQRTLGLGFRRPGNGELGNNLNGEVIQISYMFQRCRKAPYVSPP